MTEIEMPDTGEIIISHRIFGKILHICVTEFTKVLHEPERVVTEEVTLEVHDLMNDENILVTSLHMDDFR